MMGDEKTKENDENVNERVRAWICDWRAPDVGGRFGIGPLRVCGFLDAVANRWRLGRGSSGDV